MKNIITLVIAAMSLLSCKEADKTEIEPEFEDFSNIKTDDWKSKIGQEISVEGYLIYMGNNMFKIVNDSSYAQQNSILRDENYILVQTSGSSASTFNPFSELPALNGSKVKATGLLSQFKPNNREGESLMISTSFLGDKHLATILLKELPVSLGGKKFEMATINLPDLVNVFAMRPLPENRTKFAFLYSGGIDFMQAYGSYYNNIQTMYSLLLKLGYPRENIVVAYKHGVAEKTIRSTLLTGNPQEYPQIPVHFNATESGFNGALEHLKKIMAGKKAELFIMTTNHGGGYHAAEKRNYNGAADRDNDEPTGGINDYDEVLPYYETPKVITDDEFARKINALPFVVLKALFLQCFSGGFIHDLRGPNRVLISATNETEYSWGGGSRDLDLFLYSFINPIVNGPNLGSGNFYDLNKDGMLQMNEIFIGAQLAQDIAGKIQPKYKMTPQYDDDGDGKHNKPSETGFGSKLTL